ncbi:(2Fe-2S)-binding protein [Paracoccus yeei]|uniref:(2Fe-2S)-binding protein n=1 Tax=Paracoccus yeei TaxID=147645 RepID=A0A386UIV4_9RHOB|nr:Rieske 2Fe-2S domain-containing protein [Paracoccus yeei]AYF00209.1 (2Fe-2S)-binding protein [Paracoccus yeei]
MNDLCGNLVVLCHLDDIPDGEARGFLPAPDALRRIIIFRRGGHCRAFLDACPHFRSGTPMSWRADAYMNSDRTHLVCFAHGALFDPWTGDCTDGPCLGRRLTMVPIRILHSGQICLQDPAQDGPGWLSHAPKIGQ